MPAKYIPFFAALAAVLTIEVTPANAGCGCEKPPPVPATVRPHATYAGSQVTMFHPALVEGASYDVSFTASSTDEVVNVQVTASVGRDLADGIEKAHLDMELPQLPIGPASIDIVAIADGAVVASLNDDHLTVVSAPIVLPNYYGELVHSGFRAAVGRDGLVYIALDLSGLQLPMIFEAQALGLPLRFGNEDVVFYNTQGVLMQALVDDAVEPIPGMFALPAEDPARDSDILHYSRHEFVTYFLQHDRYEPHAIDADDPSWHVDGSNHIDHDHLILAIAGVMEDGTLPEPGETEAFNLKLSTHSLFRHGLVGHAAMTLRKDARTDSYDPATRTASLNGGIYSNGRISVSGSAVVGGDASGAQINVRQKAQVLGDTYLVTEPVSFMDVAIPPGAKDLGSIVLSSNSSMTIEGPGSFEVGDLILYSGAHLNIDNSNGPVTLYLSGKLQMWSRSYVGTSNGDPEQFAIYSTTGEPLDIWANGGGFHGVVYAPYSKLQLESGHFYGAFVAAEVEATGDTQVHYDETLRSPIRSLRVQTELVTEGDNSAAKSVYEDKTTTETAETESLSRKNN